MSPPLKRLIDRHQVFTEQAGLVLVAGEQSGEFGGSTCVKYSNGDVSLMVVHSRDGTIYYCTGPEWWSDCWYSIDIIWNYLEQNTEYRMLKDADHYSYFQENFSRIADVFQPSKVEQTSRELHRLELDRTKKLFR